MIRVDVDPLTFVSQGGAWPKSCESFLTLGEIQRSFQMVNAWGFRLVRTVSAAVAEP